MNAERVFVDTNVLTYLFDYSEPKKQAQAERLIRDETREIFVPKAFRPYRSFRLET